MRWLVVVLLAALLSGCSHPTTEAAGRRMIVLGIDGMDPDFLEAHWQSLPNLNRLRQEGDFRRLGTTIPPQSPVAWSTVTTGMDPGGHGLFDFIHRDPATRMPFSSMSEISDPPSALTIGPYLIPFTAGKLRLRRAGRAFWQILQDHGVHATVIRMPANFPPAECEQESLAGMGTPDMTGSTGTFTLFTSDPEENRTQAPGGVIKRIRLENGRAVLTIDGPPNSLRRDHAVTAVDMTIHADPVESAARFELGDHQFVLQKGEWSDWLLAEFPLVPLVKSAYGILRVYVKQLHPYIEIYVSPVNIDPERPALPISTPASFSRSLAEALGQYYTQGIAEDTSAWRAGVLDREEFLEQSHKVLADSLRMFRYELDRFSSGLLFYYFSSVDTNSHMLWGKYESDLLEIYKGVDQAIGEAMRQAGPQTRLLALSDHGFAPFNRAVHLNTWLMQEGFLALDDPANTSDEDGFPHVDWSRTQAYALGLNGIYLNLAGRESGGIVAPDEKDKVLDRIAQKLLAFRDPNSGLPVVDEVYFPERVFRGRNLAAAPDLIVGFRRGYRASWQTALGAVPKAAIDDNTQAWIGDHCMASREVPGVLLSNRKIRSATPNLADIAPTILAEFGVAKTADMIGGTVF